MGCTFAGRVDGLSGLVPLRLLRVDVDKEPFAVLSIPYGLPAFGNLGRRWALCTWLASRYLLRGPDAMDVLREARILPCRATR